VDANSCFPESLLAVATVDVACRYCTLAIGGGKGVNQESALAVRFLPTGNSVPAFGPTTFFHRGIDGMKALAVELVLRDILPRPECINQSITPQESEDQQVETATSS
jgi:hypothetical protein